MIHELKVDPVMWDRLADRSKTFELRRDDRGFQAGDELVLWRFDAKANDHDCDDMTCIRNYPRTHPPVPALPGRVRR
jgi:Domain of unknown function (DUF3850)